MTPSSSNYAGMSPNTSAAIKEVVYDFESQGVPAASVDPKEFMEPCRSIATLQIARDLRSDGAIQLSSLLQSLPESVRAFVAASAEEGGTVELSDETTREFCALVSNQLLDFDLTEQLQNVVTFHDLVGRQRTARQQLRRLLIASRCQFSADEAAAAYYSVDDTALKHRAQILADAMDLEGLEVQPVSALTASQEEALPPLAWYKQPNDDSVSDKRQKIGE